MMFEQSTKAASRRGLKLLAAIVAIFYLSVVGAIVAVAWHFVSKYW